MSTIIIPSLGRSDGLTGEISFGAPISKSYSGTFINDQCVIEVPDTDLAIDPDGIAECTWSAPGATPVASGTFEARSLSAGGPVFTAPQAGATLKSNTVNLAWQWDRRIDIQIHDVDPGSVASNGLDDTLGFTGANSTWSTSQPNGDYWIRAVWPPESDVWPDDPQDNYDAGRFFTFQITIDNPVAVTGGIDRAGFTSIAIAPTVNRPSFDGSDWDSIWNSGGLTTWFETNEEYISTKNVAGKKAIEIEHVPRAGTAGGTERVSSAGRFGGSGYATDVTIVERMYLPNGFDLGTASKATMKAGLGLRSNVDSSGGLPNYEGFSSRIQLRRNNGKDYYGVYLYTGNTTGYGDDEITDVEVITGEYVELAMRVKMNTTYGTSNGILQFWVNGDLKINKSNMNWLRDQASGEPASPSMRGIGWGSFHGGSGDTSWNPASNQYPAYSDIALKIAA